MAATAKTPGKAKGAAGQHSADFDAALQACQKPFRESQGRGWMPDDGEYTLLLKAADAQPKAGKTKDNKAYQMSQTVTFEIVGGDLDGKAFKYTFRTRSDKTIAGEWKAFATLLAGGDEPTDIMGCVEVIANAVADEASGTYIVASIKRREYQGSTYTNMDFLRLAESATADAEAAEDDAA